MGPGTNYLLAPIIGAWHQLFGGPGTNYLRHQLLAPIIYTLPYLLCLGPVHSPTKVNFQGSF